ncbi:MAG: OadG family protein [Clostridiales bacterium]|nr:OadG family protein [Clostridiales bacterium]
MTPVVQLAVERGQHLTISEMFMNAGIVILVVFGVLFLMYILISISGKIIEAITKAGKKEEPAKAAPAAPAAPAVAAAVAGEEFSSGTLKLKDCDEKTAAMIMAIVSDNTGIPLSELVFKSIKLVEKK